VGGARKRIEIESKRTGNESKQTANESKRSQNEWGDFGTGGVGCLCPVPGSGDASEDYSVAIALLRLQRHLKSPKPVVLYSVGNVRMSVFFGRDLMIRQGGANRQAFVCTFHSILVSGRTKVYEIDSCCREGIIMLTYQMEVGM